MVVFHMHALIAFNPRGTRITASILAPEPWIVHSFWCSSNPSRQQQVSDTPFVWSDDLGRTNSDAFLPLSLPT